MPKNDVPKNDAPKNDASKNKASKNKVPENADRVLKTRVRVQVIPGGAVDGEIRPPGSKSLTNRALICAAMADGTSTLRGALRSEDTEVMIASLGNLGLTIEVRDAGKTIVVDATGRQSCDQARPTELFVANSGTTIRFLTAALSAIGGHYRLVGVDRMHQRPIGDLVDAIEQVIDGTVTTESPEGCPPVLVRGQGWKGDEIRVGGSVSSQYLSGLMMAAGARPAPTNIQVEGELVSLPYVEMTGRVMESFGGRCERIASATKNIASATTDSELADTEYRYRVGGTGYKAIQYAIEPDASAATYFWAAAAITGGTVRVDGLTHSAMQGDVGFVDVLAKMGCEVTEDSDGITVTGKPMRGVDVDMNAISDTVQTLAPVALFADGPTRVRGVAHNRFKETDRIGDLATELRRLGADVDEHEDGMTIHPLDPSSLADASEVTLETYHDHRMAMGLSLAGLKRPGVWINDPACTGKTYPEYFADLEHLIGRPHRWA